MNTLANSLFRLTLRSPAHHNKPVVAYLTQSAIENASVKKKKSISKAMRAYIDRVKEFEQKTILASEEYDTGKRFLANIMGEDPSLFSKEDVDKAIQYLLPSGIYQEFCRPEMKPPQDIIQKAKFDDTGRPHHFMFYTNTPNLYELQHDIVKRINKADKLLEALHRKGHMPEKEHQMELISSEWVDRIALSRILNESIGHAHFDRTMIALNHLANHPMSNYFKDFIMTYRKPVVVQLTEMSFPEVQKDGERYLVSSTMQRKTAVATVNLRTPGQGEIVINKEHDLRYFEDIQAREQVIFPLQFTGMLGKVDLDIEVDGGGFSGQSGAVRLAVSHCLAALADEDQRADMQMAGLLAWDRRTKERKKFGKMRARRGYTWLKR